MQHHHQLLNDLREPTNSHAPRAWDVYEEFRSAGEAIGVAA